MARKPAKTGTDRLEEGRHQLRQAQKVIAPFRTQARRMGPAACGTWQPAEMLESGGGAEACGAFVDSD